MTSNISLPPSSAKREWLLALSALSFLGFFSAAGAFQQMSPNTLFIQTRAFSGRSPNLWVLPPDKQGDGGKEKGQRISEFTNLEPIDGDVALAVDIDYGGLATDALVVAVDDR